jgi:hypothetical protein
MANDTLDPVKAGKEAFMFADDNLTKNINLAIQGVNYNITKAIDNLGQTMLTITKQVGDSVTTIFKDTERNAFLLLQNTVQNVANMYLDTEQNLIFGLRSPTEKVIHVADNQLDQMWLFFYDLMCTGTSVCMSCIVFITLLILVAFLFLAKKEYILMIWGTVDKILRKWLT